MDFLSITLEVYLFVNYLKFIYGYVLLAANLDDFQSIAKKLGSDKFLDELLSLTNESDEKYSQKTANNHRAKKENRQVNVKEREYINIPFARQREPKSSLIDIKESGTKIDFEELVERVRQRLEKEFQKKDKNQNTNDNKRGIIKENGKNRPNCQRIAKAKLQNLKTTNNPKSTPVDKTYYYDINEENENMSRDRKVENQKDDEAMHDAINYDETKKSKYIDTSKKRNVNDKNVKNINKDDAEGLPFKKIDMLKEDSYEDYVTPAKESNIFESNEKIAKQENRFKVKYNKKSDDSISKVKVKTTRGFRHKITTDDAEAETLGSKEIKARTERLSYDYNYFNDTKLVSKDKFGTGIPTRQTYKMVSPNYYISLPTVAEKYDFNEPLPEKDRERERIKYIANPAARINKKIKLL